jgi:hypothetical protein
MGFQQYQESRQSKNSSPLQKRLPVVKIASIMHHNTGHAVDSRNSPSPLIPIDLYTMQD